MLDHINVATNQAVISRGFAGIKVQLFCSCNQQLPARQVYESLLFICNIAAKRKKQQKSAIVLQICLWYHQMSCPGTQVPSEIFLTCGCPVLQIRVLVWKIERVCVCITEILTPFITVFKHMFKF